MDNPDTDTDNQYERLDAPSVYQKYRRMIFGAVFGAAAIFMIGIICAYSKTET